MDQLRYCYFGHSLLFLADKERLCPHCQATRCARDTELVYNSLRSRQHEQHKSFAFDTLPVHSLIRTDSIVAKIIHSFTHYSVGDVL